MTIATAIFGSVLAICITLVVMLAMTGGKR